MLISKYTKAELIDEAIIKTATLSEWLIKVRNNLELAENIGEIEGDEIYKTCSMLSLIVFGITRTKEHINELLEKERKP